MSLSKINLEDLKQLRDELKLQSHLFKAETKEAWEKLESKWDVYDTKAKKAIDTALDVSEQVDTAKDLLLEEIQNGYKKIKDSLGLS